MFFPNLLKKGKFRVRSSKSEHHDRIQHIQIMLGTKFYLRVALYSRIIVSLKINKFDVN